MQLSKRRYYKHIINCDNQPIIDEHVDHILTCIQFNGSIKSRHDLLVREIRSLCHNAGLQWTDCYIGQLRTVSHVDGVTPDGYILGLSGRPFFIDVTIAHPTGATHMRNGSTRHKHFALKHLEELKIAKFEQRCNEFNSDFAPLALETYGGTSEKFDKLIEKLSSKAAEFNNIPYISNFTTTGRKGSLLFYKLVTFLLFLKLIVVSLILEQTDHSVIMIWNELLIRF